MFLSFSLSLFAFVVIDDDDYWCHHMHNFPKLKSQSIYHNIICHQWWHCISIIIFVEEIDWFLPLQSYERWIFPSQRNNEEDTVVCVVGRKSTKLILILLLIVINFPSLVVARRTKLNPYETKQLCPDVNLETMNFLYITLLLFCMYYII